MKQHLFPLAMIVSGTLFFTACKKENQSAPEPQGSVSAAMQDMISENGNNPDEAIFSSATVAGDGRVYTESNKAGQNSILVFHQDASGMLTMHQEVNSGGAGLGAGLGSQGALVLDENHHWLFAVNAGDNTVSSFSVASDGSLTLQHTAPSEGTTPNSITVYGNLLYVLNTGSSSICGFTIGANGGLSKIAGSWHALSDTAVDAPQISFEPTGRALYVSEKATNKIDLFTLNMQGAIASAEFMPAVGTTPFSFDYARDKHYLVITNASEGVLGAGTCTSYDLNMNGNLDDKNGAVPNHQGSPCWLATTRHGAFAYVSNTGSSSISSYYISASGSLYLINAVAAPAGMATIDIKVSSDNMYTYAIGSLSHTLEQFKRKPYGQLESIGTITALPEFAAGLAVY